MNVAHPFNFRGDKLKTQTLSLADFGLRQNRKGSRRMRTNAQETSCASSTGNTKPTIIYGVRSKVSWAE